MTQTGPISPRVSGFLIAEERLVGGDLAVTLEESPSRMPAPGRDEKRWRSMRPADFASVIWVGSKRGQVFSGLAADLRRRGLDVEVCEDADALPETLSRTPRAVVILRDDSGASLTDTALAALESIYRPVPVVVLAEESAFGRYYDLMVRGVRHFFSLGETPARIARAVQHTAARAA